MKNKELQLMRKKDLKELESLAQKKREELALSYAKIKAGKVKDTGLLKRLKRELAQLLTLAKEKEIIQESKK